MQQTAPSNPLTKGKDITSPKVTFTSWKTSALSKNLSKYTPLKVAPTTSGRVVVDSVTGLLYIPAQRIAAGTAKRHKCSD